MLSFTNWKLLGKTGFIGIDNFVKAITLDPVFWQVLGNTVLFTLEYLVLNIVISVGLAVAISNLRWGRQFFRMVFFLPTFTPLVGSSVVWLLIFTPGGAFDWVVATLHLPFGNMLTDPNWAMQCVVILSIWAGVGYNLMLFGAALEIDTRPIYRRRGDRRRHQLAALLADQAAADLAHPLLRHRAHRDHQPAGL